MRVLLIDDSVEMRLIQKSILIEMNIIANEAEDGSAALEMLRKDNDYDLIILDIEMPGLNGLETLKKINLDEELHEIPVLMCSTLSDKHSVFESIKHGARNYIRKPFTTDSFVRKVDSVLGVE